MCEKGKVGTWMGMRMRMDGGGMWMGMRRGMGKGRIKVWSSGG